MSLIVEEHGKVLLVVLNRPEARNALDPDTDEQLAEVFTGFVNNREKWVAVLAAEGEHFCAGADLKARGTRRSKTPPGGITRGYSTTKPIIAALLRGDAPPERAIASIAQRKKLALTHNLGGAPGDCVSFVSVVGCEPSA